MADKNNRALHMNQAEATVRTYLIDVMNTLNNLYGPSFSKENPQLVERFVRSCVLQYGADVLADAIEKLGPKIK